MKTKDETKKRDSEMKTDALFARISEKIREARARSAPFAQSNEFEERMQDLGVQEKKSVIEWRSKFSKFMMCFLVIQYVVIVSFLVLQGFGMLDFHLDNYIFYILIAGTLVQSYFLVKIIFQYLFSPKK